jgi:hypothetical protein
VAAIKCNLRPFTDALSCTGSVAGICCLVGLFLVDRIGRGPSIFISNTVRGKAAAYLPLFNRPSYGGIHSFWLFVQYLVVTLSPRHNLPEAVLRSQPGQQGSLQAQHLHSLLGWYTPGRSIIDQKLVAEKYLPSWYLYRLFTKTPRRILSFWAQDHARFLCLPNTPVTDGSRNPVT